MEENAVREFIITKNDSGQRLNKFLEKAVPRLPGGLMHKYIRLKRIKRNGKRTEFSCRLEEGDVLQLYINDEFFEAADEDTAYLHVKPDIDIVYEDEQVLGGRTAGANSSSAKTTGGRV